MVGTDQSQHLTQLSIIFSPRVSFASPPDKTGDSAALKYMICFPLMKFLISGCDREASGSSLFQRESALSSIWLTHILFRWWGVCGGVGGVSSGNWCLLCTDRYEFSTFYCTKPAWETGSFITSCVQYGTENLYEERLLLPSLNVVFVREENPSVKPPALKTQPHLEDRCMANLNILFLRNFGQILPLILKCFCNF